VCQRLGTSKQQSVKYSSDHSSEKYTQGAPGAGERSRAEAGWSASFPGGSKTTAELAKLRPENDLKEREKVNITFSVKRGTTHTHTKKLRGKDISEHEWF
jgi:hypothetical protein